MKKLRVRDNGRIIKIFIRIAIILICVILLGVFVVLGINGYVIMSGKDRVFFSADELSNTENVDCIVVLGAGLKSDGTPSHMLEDRIKVGVSILKDTGVEYILMSGDRESIYYDEPAAMKKYAEDMGIDPSRILIDNSGYSTYESITRVASEYGFDNVIIVTQKYHLYRAIYIADKSGISAVGVSADLRPYSGQIKWDVRELLARVKDFFMCM